MFLLKIEFALLQSAGFFKNLFSRARLRGLFFPELRRAANTASSALKTAILSMQPAKTFS